MRAAAPNVEVSSNYRFMEDLCRAQLQDHPHPEPLEMGELGNFTMPVGDTATAVAFYGQLFGWRFTDPGDAGVEPEYRPCTNGALPFGFTAGGDVSPSYYDVHRNRALVLADDRAAAAHSGGSTRRI